tara:strand:+ start:1006 stop:1182 length:177 start_codon:yes stop_codon:yes gene_type:complete
MIKLKSLLDKNTLESVAARFGTTYQQIQRYIKYECIVINGEIYKPVKKLNQSINNLEG